VFEPNGSFRRVLGRTGFGPGEFQNAWVIDVRSDTAWVTDYVQSRLTALPVLDELANPKSWILSGLALPSWASVRLQDGSLVLSSNWTHKDRIGFPLHRLQLDGSATSFGSKEPRYLPTQSRANLRSLALSHRGGFWAAHVEQYRVELYDQNGGVLKEYERGAPWFPPRSGPRLPPDPSREPIPHLSSIVEDSLGRVWIFAVVGDVRYREAFEPPKSPADLPIVTVWDRYFDTIIEILDSSTGRLLATTRVDPAILYSVGMARDGVLVASERRLVDGGYQAVVWRTWLRK